MNKYKFYTAEGRFYGKSDGNRPDEAFDKICENVAYGYNNTSLAYHGLPTGVVWEITKDRDGEIETKHYKYIMEVDDVEQATRCYTGSLGHCRDPFGTVSEGEGATAQCHTPER